MTAQVMHMPSSDASDSHATARANGMNPKLMAKMVASGGVITKPTQTTSRRSGFARNATFMAAAGKGTIMLQVDEAVEVFAARSTQR